jgi:hypothetical protein
MATQAESLVVTLDANVGAYTAKMKKAENATENLSNVSSIAGKNVGNFGRQSGMAGIQVQQFVGQIQGGQSAMVALSQQSADLGFVLGAPLLGAVVGITASVIGMAVAFSGANIELEEVSETVPDLIKKFNELDDAAKNLALGVLSSEIIAQEKALKDTKEALADYRTSLNLFSSIEETSAKTSEYTGTILKLELALKDLKSTYSDLSPSGSIVSAVIEGLDAQNETLLIQSEVVGEIITKNIDVANTYGMTAREIAIYKAELVGANEAQKEAILLSFDIAEAKKQEVEANQKLFDSLGQTQANPELANAQLLHEQRLADEEVFQELIAEIKFTGFETTDELYFKELEVHQAMLDSKLINEETFAKAQLKLSAQYGKNKVGEAKALDKSEKSKLTTQISAVSAALSIANGAFENNKAIQAGMVVANTASGIIRQFADLPYPAAVATSIAIAAAGAAQLSAVLSASPGGGSISPPSGGAVSSQADFQPETSSLDFTDASAGGSQSGTISFATDTGDELIDVISKLLNEREIRGAN